MGSATKPLLELAQLESHLLLVIATMARVGPLIWIAPFWGGRVVPSTVKVGLAAAISLLVYPFNAADPTLLARAGEVMLVGVLAKELLVGLAITFVVGMVFWAVQAGGGLIDTFRGGNMGEAALPGGEGRETALGALLLFWAIVIFLAIGGHRLAVAALVESYRVLPLTGIPSLSGSAQLVTYCIELSGSLWLVALALSAPALAALLLADVSLGWVNRFAPQLNVYFVAMPLKALLGLLVVLLVIGAMLEILPGMLAAAVRHVEAVVELLEH